MLLRQSRIYRLRNPAFPSTTSQFSSWLKLSGLRLLRYHVPRSAFPISWISDLRRGAEKWLRQVRNELETKLTKRRPNCGGRYLACRERHSAWPEQKYVKVQSSSVAQASCDLDLWDCCFIGYRSTDPFMVAGASFAIGSRVTVSLRRHVLCVVWWSRAGIARGRSLRSRFRLLLPAPNLLIGSKARGDTTPCHFYGVSPVCWVAERCATERHRIAQARAR